MIPQVAFSDANLNYFITEESTYLLPIVTYEKEHIHLESRYNYEDFETISLFVGRRFLLNDEYDLSIVPMFGGAGGKTDGIVPALEFSIRFGKFELYSEQEYLIDINNKHDSFFYVWSDLSYELLEWLYVGLSLQRLTPYESSRNIDYGAFVGVDWKRWSFAVYNYSPGTNYSMYILSLNYSF